MSKMIGVSCSKNYIVLSYTKNNSMNYGHNGNLKFKAFVYEKSSCHKTYLSDFQKSINLNSLKAFECCRIGDSESVCIKASNVDSTYIVRLDFGNLKINRKMIKIKIKLNQTMIIGRM
jgi:hypothetical protein